MVLIGTYERQNFSKSLPRKSIFVGFCRDFLYGEGRKINEGQLHSVPNMIFIFVYYVAPLQEIWQQFILKGISEGISMKKMVDVTIKHNLTIVEKFKKKFRRIIFVQKLKNFLFQLYHWPT